MKRSVKKLVVCGIIALMVCALCSLVAFAAADKPEPAPQDGCPRGRKEDCLQGICPACPHKRGRKQQEARPQHLREVVPGADRE